MLTAIYYILGALLLVGCFYRAVQMDPSNTSLPVRTVFQALTLVAVIVLAAPVLVGYQPDFMATLLLAAITGKFVEQWYRGIK